MKSFIAYALLVIGIPQILGVVVGGIVTVPITRLLHFKTNISMVNLTYLAIVNGLVAAVAGAFLFRLFGLTPGLLVPVIMAAWITYYFFAYHQQKWEWLSWLAGIFIGWLTLAKMITG